MTEQDIKLFKRFVPLAVANAGGPIIWLAKTLSMVSVADPVTDNKKLYVHRRVITLAILFDAMCNETADPVAILEFRQLAVGLLYELSQQRVSDRTMVPALRATFDVDGLDGVTRLLKSDALFPKRLTTRLNDDDANA